MFTQKVRPRAGFSSVDLLVGVLVFGTALGIAIPGCQKTHEPSHRSVTMNNLGQCAKAVHLSHDQFKTFPPYFGIYGPKAAPFTFHVHLLPFLDQEPLYNVPLPNAVVGTYLSIMDPTLTNDGANACNFPVNLRLFYTQGGLGELSPPNNPICPQMRGTFSDGVSQTLLFANKYMNCGTNGGSRWLDPGDNAIDSPTAATFGKSMALWQEAPTKAACDPIAGTAVSFHTQAIMVALCDASVRSVSVGISQSTWQAVHTPSGNDAIGQDWVE